MRLHELQLENFRGFERQTVQLDSPVILLIGDNGTGKSTVLAALLFTVSRTLAMLLSETAPAKIRTGDFRVTRFLESSVSSVEPQLPLRLRMTATVDGESVESAIELTQRSEVESATVFSNPADERLRSAVARGDHIVLPLFAAYGADRADKTIWPLEERTGSRLDGYQSATHARADARSFSVWLRQHTGISLQRGLDSPEMNAVLTAMRHAIPQFKNVRWDFASDELLAETIEHTEAAFSELSAGQRALLGLFCDLAYRCVVLNPHLGAEACLETRGVVLIDEIDLHLHPEWQKDVIPSLREAFPNLQIIATTHSPFVIQSVGPETVIDLSTHDDVEIPLGDDYRKQSIEDIAEGTQGVKNPQWSRKRERLAEAAERYYTLLRARNGNAEDDPEVAAAKRELDEASIPFSEDTAFAIYRAMRDE